jgi:hypothetical protein
MDYDREKVDEVVLALMQLTLHGDQRVTRAWKGFDWDSLDRLYEKRHIGNPKSKAKSVVLTEEGQRRSAELFEAYFGVRE